MSGNIDSGGRIHPGDPVVVDRYTPGARANHWVTAICLILLALSGLALFTPSLFFLTGLFGGGQTTRAIHPWIGVVLFLSFSGLFFRFWKLNLWKREDGEWIAHAGDLVAGHEERMPEVGKYNAGQKMVFWGMSLLIIVLIASGLTIWDEYFFAYTTIPTKRIAVLVHAISAVLIISVWIVHVYAAIWVRGTMGAMTKGQVTGGWAWRHHRKWLKDLVTADRQR
ncbi:MAG: formate dehydrogenase subunit gamma [Methylobacteriaceae bacterium]|nr:formate dehydrogenase subunit gamma [Methylobacteriaceae bacterium]